MDGDRRPNIRDVATRAGVSISTVSKVLNHGVGSARVVARVHRAADDLGYRPNRQAARLRRGTTGVIGVLVPDLANPLYVPYLRGAAAVAQRRGRIVQIVDGEGTESGATAAVGQLATERVDGVLVAGPVPPVLTKALRAAGIEVHPDRGADRAYLRSWEAAEAAATNDLAERLISLGHRHAAWITTATSARIERAYRGPRFDAFSAAFTASGGHVETAAVAAHPGDGASAPAALLRATAVICATHVATPVVLTWLRHLGRTIGSDVSVAAYGDSNWTTAVEPALAIIRRDTFAEGSDAADTLIDRIDGVAARPRREPTAAFVDRPSIGPPTSPPP